MDRSKNRTDMLAAGRKKLQQFRQKKGGGSPAKSSSSHAKHGNENESEEPSKLSQSTLASTADLASLNHSNASSSGTVQRAEEFRSVSDQLPSGLDIQEVQDAVFPNVASLIVGHDLDENSSSGINQEASGTSSSSEVVHERDGDISVSYVNSQTDVAEKQNGEAYQTGIGAADGETSSELHDPVRVQESNNGSFLADRVQCSGLNPSLSEEMEKDAHQEQNFKGSASSQITYAQAENSHELVPVVFGNESERILLGREKAEVQEQNMFEDKIKVINDPAFYLDSAEESQGESSNVSHEFKEDTSLQKKIVRMPSTIDTSLNDKVLHLEPVERASEGGKEHYSPVEFVSARDECHDKQPEEAVSVKDIIVDSHKERISSLHKHRMMNSSISGQFEPDGMLLMDGKSADEFESVKRHLYLSYIAKDFLQLQLVEQNQLNEGFNHHSSHEEHALFDLVKEAQESKEKVTKELVQCNSELKHLSIVKDETENKCLLARREIEQEYIKCRDLKNELHKSQEGSLHLSKELAVCKSSLDALQKENSTLLASFVSETDARKKLVEEVEILSSKNMILLTELKAKEQTLQITLEKKVKLQDSLREFSSCFEQLIEDNFYFSCSLDVHKAKFKEIGSWIFDSTCHGQEGQFSYEDLSNCSTDMSQMIYVESHVDASSSLKLKSNSLCQKDASSLQKIDGYDSDSYALFQELKEQLQLAKIKLQDLEKSLKGMHSHSLSLSGSVGIATTAGVSKLIKAFESKSNHIGIGVGEAPLTVCERPEDSYTLAFEQALSLSNTLNRMELELGKVEIHVMGNQHNKEALKKFKMDCQSQKYQNNSLQVAFDGLAKKLIILENQIYEMQNHISDLDQHVNEKATGFLYEVELLKGEVSEGLFILKQERDNIVGMILEAVGKLDASTGLKVLEDLDTKSHVMASVDTAILSIEKLHDKLEELNKSFIDIQEKHFIGSELFYKFYSSIMELINEAQQDGGDAAMNAIFDEVLEPLPEKCEMVVNYLRKLLDEHAYLFSRNNKLDLDLSIRNREMEELNTQLKELELQKNINGGFETTLLIKTKEIEDVKQRCFFLANELKGHESCKGLYAPGRSCERDVVVSKDANDLDSCNSLLLQLEELVAFHLHNYEEIAGQIMSSRKLLQDANMLKEVSADDFFIQLPTLLSQVVIPRVINLHENMKLLTVSNVENETEIQILKEGKRKMEETLEASYHELQLKTSEVEQLEQKLSSVREKLSIAVAKGKGLIVQRDSLKQVLMEKTSELETSAQDLILKESLLDELEKKLKSCSEVERIEALESELIYIRNSATVLRDSFLQKDSVLQKIEEVLEDLDLPDDFHDKDIIEKIELLSRFAVGHSFSTVTDLEQKCSEEHIFSDATERDNKSCFMLASAPDFDEMKRKHDELQGKFYGLAEHNDMLEQSLLERNILVQKCEEILGKIDLPSHMLTMEPDNKIEWLGKELFDLNQERDSLQLKIDNLEISSDMLIVDVEESHKKISELTAEVAAVKSEKEFFSESLEKLRFEYFALSEKVVHDEQDRDNLLKELDGLQDKLIDSAQLEYYKGMENNLQKLHDLVNNTLTESDKVNFLSGGTLAENLEESLKKLIDIYTSHLNKVCISVPDNDALFNESSPYHGKMVPEEVLLDKESDLASIRLELDHTSNKLASVEEDRSAIFAKCESLRLEIEDLKMHVHLLNGEKNENLVKYQSVMLKLDVISKQRDYLQEQLTQEEQKSVSFKEKLNLAVRKGKGLVQQRDSLKQTIDEINALLEQLKVSHSQQTEALISDKSLLMNQLAEMELQLKDRNLNYSRLLTALNDIDLVDADNKSDPVQKLRVLGGIILDVRSQATATELEANKSKRAAELLLAELNEVQERNDFLQEELLKVEASLAECSTQKDDSLSRLEHFMSVHSAERARLANNLLDFMSGIDQLRRGFMSFSKILAKVLSKDVDFFSYVEDLKMFSFDEFCSPDTRQPIILSSDILLPNDPKDEPIFDIAQYKVHQHLDETLLFEHLAFAGQTLHQCMSHCDELREHVCKHSEFLDKKMVHMLEAIDAVKRKDSALKDTSESLSRDIIHLESKLQQKDAKISSLYRNLTILYEACSTSVLECVKRKSQITGNSPTHAEGFGNFGIVLKLPILEEDGDVHSLNSYIKMMTNSILSTLKDASSTNDLVEKSKMEFKATVLTLQRELQEKDIQMSKVSEELVSQIRGAEAVAKRSMIELDSSRAQVSNLEMKTELMEADRKLLESRLNELQDVEALSKLLQERANSLEDTVKAKDLEIEALMQAIDEEETQMEVLDRNNKDMENLVQKKMMQLETLEACHTKTMSKLSTTVSKFDELHNLSENLLAEIENLQSQLQHRDSEISFLRQEVTRCTNDVLALQGVNKKYSSDVHELVTWMSSMVTRIGGPPLPFDDQEASSICSCIEITGKKISSAITELEELRSTVQCKDALLETERCRVQEILSKTGDIETSRKERLKQSQVGRTSEQHSSSNSLEIEKVVQRNKVSSGPIATHVRSGRIVNNDQIAIAIDTENDGILEDEDNDKSHGFKSLTMSRLVPRAARPIADRIDGIWVSIERFLMRQPALRLAFLMYWFALHALLASFV